MSVAMHARHSERPVMLYAERRQFRYAVCFLLGNSPVSEFYKILMPGNYPEESIQHSEHGESLKSGKFRYICSLVWSLQL